MKLYVFVLLIIAAVALALPVQEEHHRVRRVTCDLLSGLNVNHSACAAHCIARGKTGGRCNDGVCQCRK
ncbi:hypothetical protein PUN28_012771 [Cardiocondyla obscurior]